MFFLEDGSFVDEYSEKALMIKREHDDKMIKNLCDFDSEEDEENNETENNENYQNDDAKTEKEKENVKQKKKYEGRSYGTRATRYHKFVPVIEGDMLFRDDRKTHGTDKFVRHVIGYYDQIMNVALSMRGDASHEVFSDEMRMKVMHAIDEMPCVIGRWLGKLKCWIKKPYNLSKKNRNTGIRKNAKKNTNNAPDDALNDTLDSTEDEEGAEEEEGGSNKKKGDGKYVDLIRVNVLYKELDKMLVDLYDSDARMFDEGDFVKRYMDFRRRLLQVPADKRDRYGCRCLIVDELCINCYRFQRDVQYALLSMQMDAGYLRDDHRGECEDIIVRCDEQEDRTIIINIDLHTGVIDGLTSLDDMIVIYKQPLDKLRMIFDICGSDDDPGGDKRKEDAKKVDDGVKKVNEGAKKSSIMVRLNNRTLKLINEYKEGEKIMTNEITSQINKVCLPARPDYRDLYLKHAEEVAVKVHREKSKKRNAGIRWDDELVSEDAKRDDEDAKREEDENADNVVIKMSLIANKISSESDILRVNECSFFEEEAPNLEEEDDNSYDQDIINCVVDIKARKSKTNPKLIFAPQTKAEMKQNRILRKERLTINAENRSKSKKLREEKSKTKPKGVSRRRKKPKEENVARIGPNVKRKTLVQINKEKAEENRRRKMSTLTPEQLLKRELRNKRDRERYLANIDKYTEKRKEKERKQAEMEENADDNQAIASENLSGKVEGDAVFDG